MDFGQKIKQLRIEKGWNQNYVANALNISVPALSRYESGTYEPKSMNIIHDFAQLFGVPTDYFFGLDLDYKSEDCDFFEGYKSLNEKNKQILKDTLEVFLRSQGGK